MIIMNFDKYVENNLSGSMLKMLHVDQKVFVSVDETGRITDMTKQAKYLLRQNIMDDIGEVLRSESWRILEIVLREGQPATTEDDIDGEYYQLDISPIEGGALLLFTPLQPKPVVLPFPMQEKMQVDLEVILLHSKNFPRQTVNPLDNIQRETLENIQLHALRMLRSLRHASLLSKRADIIPNLKMLDFQAFCAGLCSRTQQVCQERGIFAEITFEPSKNSCVFAFDPELITRAVLGLLTNAVFASPYVRVKVTSNKDNAWVTVVNSGKKITPEDLERYYDGWTYDMDDNDWIERKIEKETFSTGLPLIRKIAAWHGGTLLFNTEENSICFRLTLSRVWLPPEGHQWRIEEGISAVTQELSVLEYRKR